jgi:hypothetical protein
LTYKRLAATTQIVAVAVSSLDKGVFASGTPVRLLLAVRFLVVDHVAELGGFDVAVKALEKLVGSSSRVVHHILFHEAQVARVVAVPVAHPLLDHLFQGAVIRAEFGGGSVLEIGGLGDGRALIIILDSVRKSRNLA